ncbi:DRC1 protein, partial [Bombycilla garrulus]|nr:DRC1 protein [Bombycilla garrulus]
LMRSSAEKFRRVWAANEEEAKALIRRALDADRIIHVQQLGMPWEEPQFWFMDNAGPPERRREKRDATHVATQLLEVAPELGIREKPRSRFLGFFYFCGSLRNEGGNAHRVSVPLFPAVFFFPKGFLLENKLLKPLR